MWMKVVLQLIVSVLVSALVCTLAHDHGTCNDASTSAEHGTCDTAPAIQMLQTGMLVQSHIREWILCKGNNLQVADIEMQMQGETLSNVMACTLPHNITALCCMDFTKLAFTEKIALEFAVTPMQNETDKEDKVMICTSKRPKIPRVEPGSVVQINEKLECQGMMYAMSDIRNGTAFFDSRIEWLVDQDVRPESIETCRELIRKCPHGTELAGKLPNSASDKVLSGLLTASEVVAESQDTTWKPGRQGSIRWSTRSLLQVDRAAEMAEVSWEVRRRDRKSVV